MGHSRLIGVSISEVNVRVDIPFSQEVIELSKIFVFQLVLGDTTIKNEENGQE